MSALLRLAAERGPRENSDPSISPGRQRQSAYSTVPIRTPNAGERLGEPRALERVVMDHGYDIHFRMLLPALASHLLYRSLPDTTARASNK
jgi:hypothetical protein